MSSEFSKKFAEYGRTLDCVHCGLCIPHCPTHGVTGREADSPRGRIHLMRAWSEGRLELTDGAQKHLDQCIVCRACESVCPSGIHMGDMMESLRAERPSDVAASPLGRFALRSIVPHRDRIALLTRLMSLYERTPLPGLVQRGLVSLAPGLAAAHGLRPRLRDRKPPLEAGRTHPARGEERGRVALFLGCIASEWFAGVHHATIRVLTANGITVVVPSAQTCCGALHRHAGLLDDAKSLQRDNDLAFPADLDTVIVNAAGCGASLREPLEERPAAAPRYLDVFVYLHELGLRPPTRAVERAVAYDEPCHLVHGQKVPRSVVADALAQIPSLRLVDLPGSDRCCGAGGIYNLIHSELAQDVLAPKLAAIRASGADTVVTGNPGCLMQIAHGLGEDDIAVRHPIELLAEAYE